MEIKEDKQNWLEKIFFADCIWKNDEIIFPSQERNALCRMNKWGDVTLITRFPEEYDGILLYGGIYEVEDGVYLFCPRNSVKKALVVYREKEQRFCEICLAEEIRTDLNFIHSRVFMHRGLLYIVCFEKLLIVLDIQRGSVRRIDFPYGKEGELLGEVKRQENILYVAARHRHALYVFDLPTEQFSVMDLPPMIKGSNTVTVKGNCFWLTGDFDGICCYDSRTGQAEFYTEYPQGFTLNLPFDRNNQGRFFQYSLLCGEEIIFFPAFANQIVRMNTRTKKMHEVTVRDEEENERSLHREGRFSVIKYTAVLKKGNQIIFESFKNKCIYLLDIDSEKVQRIEPHWKAGKAPKMYSNWPEFVVENSFPEGTLKDYIEHVELFRLQRNNSVEDRSGATIFRQSGRW